MAISRSSTLDGAVPSVLVRDVALGAIAGAVALAINLLPLTIGFGLEFHLGGFVAFLLLPRSLVAAAIAGAIGAAWLPIAGEHLAFLVSAVEVLVVAVAVRHRDLDLVVADGLFWVLLGLPAAFLVHRLQGDGDIEAAAVAMEQGMNGFFGAGVACLARLLRHLDPAGSRQETVPLRAVFGAIVSVAAIATVVLMLWIDVRLHWRLLIEEQSSSASLIDRHQRWALVAMLIAALVSAIGLASAWLLARATTRRIEHIRRTIAAGPSFRFEPRAAGEAMITEIRRLEREIADLSVAMEREAADALQMRRRIETITMHAPIIVHMLDVSDGRMAPTYVTRSIERLLGHAPDDALTMEWWRQNLHPDDATVVLDALRRLPETRALSAEFRLRQKTGDYRWMYEELRVIDDPQAMPLEAVGVMIDISERKQSETRLIETANLVALGEMSAGVAHELTQPLHVIGLAAENLLEEVATTAVVAEKAVIKLRDIVEQTHRAADIVRRMRELGRRVETPPTAIRLGQAIESALRPIELELQAYGIKLSIDGDGLQSWIQAQPNLIEQILVNLTMNARDAIHQRHVEVRPLAADGDRIDVRATVRPQSRAVAICVRDTGTGIEPTALHRAFEPFFTTKDVGKGLGLGLSICHGIVRDLGGTIELRNWKDGAEIEVVFPTTTEPAEGEPAAFRQY